MLEKTLNEDAEFKSDDYATLVDYLLDDDNSGDLNLYIVIGPIVRDHFIVVTWVYPDGLCFDKIPIGEGVDRRGIIAALNRQLVIVHDMRNEAEIVPRCEALWPDVEITRLRQQIETSEEAASPKVLCDVVDAFYAKGGGWRHLDELTSICVHEAGHAVAHYLFRRDSLLKIIIHGHLDRGRRKIGGAVYFKPFAGLDAPENVECLSAWPQSVRLDMVARFAGPAAERRFIVEATGYQIALETCAGDWSEAFDACTDTGLLHLDRRELYETSWCQAQDLIADESNWNAILALAKELQRHRRTCGGLMPGWRAKQIFTEIFAGPCYEKTTKNPRGQPRKGRIGIALYPKARPGRSSTAVATGRSKTLTARIAKSAPKSPILDQ